MERELDFEAGKPQEVAVVGAKRRAMFYGQRGKVSIYDERSSDPVFRQEAPQNWPMPFCWRNDQYIASHQPIRDDFGRLSEVIRERQNLRSSGDP